jgi:hypothetical protein
MGKVRQKALAGLRTGVRDWKEVNSCRTTGEFHPPFELLHRLPSSNVNRWVAWSIQSKESNAQALENNEAEALEGRKTHMFVSAQ